MAHTTNRIWQILQDGYVQAKIIHYNDEEIHMTPRYYYEYISYGMIVCC